MNRTPIRAAAFAAALARFVFRGQWYAAGGGREVRPYQAIEPVALEAAKGQLLTGTATRAS
jgi:hypothetical protein